jgi:transcriptional regulator GlxA family with amidase domain
VKDAFIYRALKQMHRQVGYGWTVTELARTSGLSRKIFLGRFKGATGRTPLKYLARLRMNRAKELLRTTRQPLRQIAQEVGYGDAFAFSKPFKRIEACTPKKYRKAGGR